MTLTVNIAWVLTIVLVAVRVGAAIALTPVLGVTALPAHVRVMLVLGLALTVAAGLPGPLVSPAVTFGQFAAAAASETVIGLTLAFGLFAAFATFLLAGRILDMQLGFGVASLIDPATRTQAPLIGFFLNLLAVVIFFSVDGHHALIRGLVYSLEVFPPGTSLSRLEISAVVGQFGSMFVYAIAVVAPVIFVVFLIDILLAVIARTMPQVNVFIVGLPLKIFVGLTVLALSLMYLTPVLKRVFETLFSYWYALLG